jgi:hypothetical protein
MTQAIPHDLWRDFPKTATAFEARFATEEDCWAYWIAARWGGEPSCALQQHVCVDDLRHQIQRASPISLFSSISTTAVPCGTAERFP